MKYQKIEMIGKTFGSYLVLKESHQSKDGTFNYYCKCECGKFSTINGVRLRKNNPKCNHFRFHNMSSEKIYKVYKGIIARCYKTYFHQYKDYGGRGISVCEEWIGEKGFLNFYNWSKENGYKQGLQIDRINNDGNYEPKNCRFVTHSVNSGVGAQRKREDNKTGYNGVCFSQEKYRAFITHNKKRYELGCFKNLDDAIKARIKKEIELFGEQKTNLDYKF